MKSPRYSDLPIRAKLFAPFAVLMVVWGGFGTYVLAHGSRTELRGQATARLVEALDGAQAAFSDVERGLLETVRLAANTQGVSHAVTEKDSGRLRSLLLPIALNAGVPRLECIDGNHDVLLRIDAPRGDRAPRSSPSVTAGGRLNTKIADLAVRGVTDDRGDKRVAVSGPRLQIAGPVRNPGGRAVGAVVVSEDLSQVTRRMARGAGDIVALFSSEGTTLATTSPGAIPFRSVAQGTRATAEGRGGPYEVLYTPLDARGEHVGVLAVALPSRVAVAGMRGAAIRLAGLVGLAVLAALAIGLATARAITRRLGSLLRAIKELQSGDMGARARYAGTDEVGVLADAFNRMATELQASHEELESKVAERTAQLEHANAAKSTFLATMSHELRTPLNAIIGFADMLSDPTFGRVNSATTRELSGHILTSGRHLLGLISDLLDLAKIEAGRIDLAPQPLDLAAVVAGVEATLAPLAREKDLQLESEIGPSPSRVEADPARLRQILLNLLSNSIKFTPDGGRIWVGATYDDDMVTVEVSDTGRGLTQQDLLRIFEPYERGRAAGDTEGTGLGLALTKHLVELQGGHIWATGRPGRGSTFRFTLPIARPDAAGGRRAS